MKYSNRFLLLTLSMLSLLACSKEYSLETGGTGGPGSGGGNTLTNYGWSFTGKPTEDFYGCIDTAFYETNGSIKALLVEGTDSAGNSFIIMLVSPSGNITAGSYTIAQGASMTVTDRNGNTFSPKPPSPFSLQLTKVNDTIVEGNFSGTLTNLNDNTTFNVANGQLKALIGKENPCGATKPDPGGGIDAEFVLTSSNGSCSDPIINGDYYRTIALDDSNTVELAVNVTVAGKWKVTTTATNGMVFTGSGTFTSTGANRITLTGSGNPTTTGLIVIPLQAGGSSCNFTIPVQATVVAVPGNGDYFPTTTNSYWVYNFIESNSGLTDSFQVTSTGKISTIGGQNYNEFENDIFAGVYRKANGNYYRYGLVDYFGFIDTTQRAETVFLKDNVAQNSTWDGPVINSTLGGNPVKVKRSYTITARNVALAVKGVIYNNVITVKEVLMIEIAGAGYQPFEETIISYSRGIGLIQAQNVNYKLKLNLKRFQVQ